MSRREIAGKSEVVKKYRINPKDTGSPEVQVALLTQRLGELAKHFEKHGNDLLAQRGLKVLVSRRKSLLSYLKDEDNNRYKNVISALGIRK